MRTSEWSVFISYSSIDRAEADALEAWLRARSHAVWIDRRDIQPGAPDFLPPILDGIASSANVLILLSPRWLRSPWTLRELEAAQAANKKILVVVPPVIARHPSTGDGRERKAELMAAMEASPFAATIGRMNWIWPRTEESEPASFEPVDRAIATDFDWKSRHAIIVQRLRRWQAHRDAALLLRGAELAELAGSAFEHAPGREPSLADDERAFLLESQRHEAAEHERLESLYWNAQSRSVAFAAVERRDAAPEVALMLAAEAATVATAPEARAALLSVLHRHARLTRAIHDHGPGRAVAGVAFSRDGQWMASSDRSAASGDHRRGYLLIHDAATGREVRRVAVDPPGLSCLAWGESWLAIASPKTIGWLRWDTWEERFSGNTPTPLDLDDRVAPDHLAFSPTGALPSELLAWGTRWGDVGLIRTADHVRWQCRLGADTSDRALTGLAWLGDGRLLTAESGRILVRPVPDLEPAQEIAAPGTVLSLDGDRERWVARCVSPHGAGLLIGQGDRPERFVRTGRPPPDGIAMWAGRSTDEQVVITSASRRTGAARVAVLNLRDDASAEHAEILLGGEDQLVRSIASDASGRFVAAGEARGPVWLWDRARRSHLVRALQPGMLARCIAASRSRAAIAMRDGPTRIYATSFAGEPVATADWPFVPSRLRFADEGKLLLALSQDDRLAVQGAAGSITELAWPDRSSEHRCIHVAADAPVVAARTASHRISVYRLSGTSLEQTTELEVGHAVVGLALDRAGKRIHVIVERLGFQLIALRAADPAEPPLEIGLVRSLMPTAEIVFPREDLVAFGDDDDVVFASTEDPSSTLRRGGHDEPVKHLIAGPGIVGSVACWFQDTDVDELRLWTDDGQPLGPVTLPEHAAEVAIAPDGRSVVVLGASSKLWQIDLRVPEWARIARALAGRDLTLEEQRSHGVDVWRARAQARQTP